MPGYLKYMTENVIYMTKILGEKKIFYPVFLVDVQKNLPTDLMTKSIADIPHSVILIMNDLAKVKAVDSNQRDQLIKQFRERL